MYHLSLEWDYAQGVCGGPLTLSFANRVGLNNVLFAEKMFFLAAKDTFSLAPRQISPALLLYFLHEHPGIFDCLKHSNQSTNLTSIFKSFKCYVNWKHFARIFQTSAEKSQTILVGLNFLPRVVVIIIIIFFFALSL